MNETTTKNEKTPMSILDWKKLKAFVARRKPIEVSAGILGDWYWTAATVYKDGKFNYRSSACTASCAGTPGFEAEMKNGDTIRVVAYQSATKRDVNRLARAHKSTMEKLKAYVARAEEARTQRELKEAA